MKFWGKSPWGRCSFDAPRPDESRARLEEELRRWFDLIHGGRWSIAAGQIIVALQDAPKRTVVEDLLLASVRSTLADRAIAHRAWSAAAHAFNRRGSGPEERMH